MSHSKTHKACLWLSPIENSGKTRRAGEEKACHKQCWLWQKANLRNSSETQTGPRGLQGTGRGICCSRLNCWLGDNEKLSVIVPSCMSFCLRTGSVYGGTCGAHVYLSLCLEEVKNWVTIPHWWMKQISTWLIIIQDLHQGAVHDSGAKGNPRVSYETLGQRDKWFTPTLDIKIRHQLYYYHYHDCSWRTMSNLTSDYWIERLSQDFSQHWESRGSPSFWNRSFCARQPSCLGPSLLRCCFFGC